MAALLLGFLFVSVLSAANAGSNFRDYDSTSYTECMPQPSNLLYDGGVVANPSLDQGLQGWACFGGCSLQLQNQQANTFLVATQRSASYQGPSQSFNNLQPGMKYTLSAWMQVDGPNPTIVRATVKLDNQGYATVGSVIAQKGCWSFLSGGFTIDEASTTQTLYFETIDSNVDIWIDNVSLQPFTDAEWKWHQETRINLNRKQTRVMRITDNNGNPLANATIKVNQVSMGFPFGTAIASTILNNIPYQKWFLERFNVAVFENELKWYSTEPERNRITYDIADSMLAFCSNNHIEVRGHNVLWDDPSYQPNWVKNLGTYDLRVSSFSRVRSVMRRYARQLKQWDVLNEMLHFSFFEDHLGEGVSREFYRVAQQVDPSSTLFLNDYNIIENPNDMKSTPDAYIRKILEIKRAGIASVGIGIEGHFTGAPNIAYMRVVLDKLATLGLPIWLTEVDLLSSINPQNQAIYLDQILREAFSHPAVKGIILWSALHPSGCYRMCLTDNNFRNLPTGNTVDTFIRKIQSGSNVVASTSTDGRFSFTGYHGTYEVTIVHGNRTTIVGPLTISKDGGQNSIQSTSVTNSLKVSILS